MSLGDLGLTHPEVSCQRDAMHRGLVGLAVIVGLLGGIFATPLAEFGSKAVVQPFIVVERHLGMIVQTVMHRFLRVLVDKAVFGRNMQHQQ